MDEKTPDARWSKLSPAKQALLRQALRRESGKASEPRLIPRRPQQEPAPLSHFQRRLWFLDYLEPGNAFYNISRAFILSGPLDEYALQNSLREIVRRHEILRTSFDLIDGEPVQKIDKERSLEIGRFELQGIEEQDRESELKQLLTDLARQPFDLANGSLMRVFLIKLSAQKHALLFVIHHIISDGWSMDVLLRELKVLYEAFLEDKPSPLAELPIQYADFAVWQRQQELAMQPGLAYWKKRLGGDLQMLAMPTDRPRGSTQSFRGKKQTTGFPAPLTKSIKRLCHQEGTTSFLILLTAFNTLLHRYSGQDEIVVGTPVANRDRTELEGLIGFFVNTLVLRADLSGDPSFKDLLNRVKQTMLQDFEHRDITFEKLVEILQPERRLSHTPLFQVLFALLNIAPSPLTLPGLDVTPLTIDAGTAMFDLTFYVEEQPEAMSLTVQYNSDLFEAETIARMSEHFQTLLESIIANPDQRLSELAILPEAERHQLLVEWNRTAADYPKGQCIHQLFESQVARTPEATALVYETERLSYRELNSRANRLAHYLRKLGVGPEVSAGIFVERSVEMVVAIIGVLKAGGAYIPLDPAYPKERLDFILSDSRIAVLLTQQKLFSRLPGREAATVCLDGDWQKIASESQENPVNTAMAENLAYVIYTSGSTGRPKGVAIAHESAATLLHWAKDAFTQDELSAVLASTSICFDLSVFELMVPLAWGGKVILAENALSLAGMKAADEVTLINTVPSAMRELIGLEAVPQSVITVNLAGEPLRNDLAQQLYRQNVGRVFNLYGPSEDTTYSTWTQIGKAADSEPTIGRPIPNTQLYILDSNMRPVPVGVAGELYISGDGLARNYLNRPELTAEKFLPNPFAQYPGARMYRTGDLVRYLSGGEVEFLGRADHQVKIRGFRIELGEIESSLLRHPSVKEAIVTAREDSPGDKRLVAYVVFREEQAISVKELKSHLTENLPAHMVPSAFVVLSQVPLTPNGKIDRRALPAPQQPHSNVEGGAAVPRTPVEEVVTAVWCEVFKIRQVSTHANFFDLGGHSLLATRVISRLRNAFGVEIPLRKMFESPTIAELASDVEAILRDGQAIKSIPLRAMPRGSELPLSFAQQRLWFLDQLDPGNPAYNLPLAIRFKGPTDLSALEQAINEIVRRHESLRTRFGLSNGQPVQIVDPASPRPVPVTDVRQSSPGDPEVEMRRLASEEGKRPFNLATGPLLRVRLLRLDEQDHLLILVMHHIVSDGWSIGVLIRELTALYESYSSEKPSPLPELELQYADFAVWQRVALRDEVLNEQLDYWKRQLAGAPPALELPTDRPRPPVQTTRGASLSMRLPSPLAAALEDLSRKEGATLHMTVLAAFNILLSRYSGQEDILVGTPIANRNRSEVENLIGFFVNTLVLRTRTSGDPTCRQLLARVRKAALEAYTHQDLPFERLVEELQPERDMSRNALYQVMFNTIDFVSPELHMKGLSAEVVPSFEYLAKFDLTLYLKKREHEVELELAYNADLFDRRRMAEALDQFARLLQQIVDNPDERISRYDLLTSGSKNVLPDPSEPLPFKWESAVHEAFLRQAGRVPDKIALKDREGSWTYEQLDERSSQLANFLLESGISSQDIVAVYGARSASLVCALLGILKAGGAFLILDQAYPPARLIDYLKAAEPKGWLQLEAAGPLPEALAEFAEASRFPVALVLPEREDETAALLSPFSVERPNIGVGPDDLAYVAFTSGSTGSPKGISGTHAPLSHFLSWHTVQFGLKESDRFCLLSGLSHDPLLRDIFTPLWLGATLSIPDPDEMVAPGWLREWMSRERISIAHLTPAMGQLLDIRSKDARGNGGPDLGSLRYAFFGGDLLTGGDVSRLKRLAPGATCVNFYGATETPQAMGYFIVPDCERAFEDEPSGAKAAIPVGRGIDGVQLLVLSASLRMCAPGEAGEIYVRTPYLAAGYIGDRALTSERFINNPFTGAEGDRLYRTGDLGRYRLDGNVDMIGRADHQVKIRGFRVEPAEIEAVFITHEAVRGCVALAREESPGNRRLVAYLLVDSKHPPRARDLRDFASEKMPSYMVPSAFVIMDEFPLTANGKIDRRALPRPESVDSESEYLPPRTPVEGVLAAIWSEVLKVEQTGINDNFFAAGGHSLLAAQIMSRVRDCLKVEAPLRALFEEPTIMGLARRIEAAQRAAQGLEAPPIVPLIRNGKASLSFQQEWLWLALEAEGNSSIYNMRFAATLTGQLDVSALQASLSELVRRHESLRTGFARIEGQAVQVISDVARAELPLLDLSEVEEEKRSETLRRLAEEEGSRPFDLSRGPMLRAMLLRLADQEHVLLITRHHIASDGWSRSIMLRELTALYNAYSTGGHSPLPRLEIQYADYAEWQRGWLRGATLERLLSYWKHKVKGAPVLQLPTDRPRPKVLREHNTALPVSLSPGLTKGLKDLSRRSESTLFMTLLAAFDALIFRHTKQEDIVVGTDVANRNRAETEEIIGFFLNTLALRSDISGDPSFLELLKRVKETTLGAYEHQDLPFDLLVEELKREGELDDQMPFRVMFVLQNMPKQRLDFRGLTVRPLLFSESRAGEVLVKFDLELILAETEDGISGALGYNADLFDAGTVAVMVREFETLLERVVTDPQQPISELIRIGD